MQSLTESLGVSQTSKRDLISERFEVKARDLRIKKALQLIENDLSKIHLPEIARLSGMSSRNFNRLFLIDCGMNPKEYIILRRIDSAQILLRESNKTITDISLEVGYNSLSKFIGTFKKITGQLPSDYRNNQKQF